LQSAVVPVLEQAQLHDPTRTTVVLEALYGIALKLVAQGWMGPRAASRLPEAAWSSLLCAAPGFLCQQPAVMASSLANALLQLAGDHSNKAGLWHKSMMAAIPHAQSASEWLNAGLVIAWRCGLPHYRLSALNRAEALAAGIGSAALGLPAALPQEQYRQLLQDIAAQPWVAPADWSSIVAGKAQLTSFGFVSGFVGFGGHFSTPPRAFANGERLVLCDDEKAWSVEADCFGTLLKPLASMPDQRPDQFPMQLGSDGTIATRYGKWKLEQAAGASSHASNSTTMIVVPRNTHRVLVLGLRLP
jgi:hypothetical protein